MSLHHRLELRVPKYPNRLHPSRWGLVLLVYGVPRGFLPPQLSLRETEIICFRSSGKPWADTPSNPPFNEQSPQSRVTSFAAIQSLQEEEKLPKGKQKQSLKEIQEEEEARAAEEDFLKWWGAEEERVRKEEEEAVKAAISMAEGGSSSGGAGKRQRGRGGGNRKSSRGKQQPERRHTALPTGG